jgi:hypothetical protein
MVWVMRYHESALAAVLVGGLLCAGCSGGSSAPSPESDAPFVAQTSDFAGFCSWSHAPATAPGDAGDGVHGLGPLTVYWNRSPPHGSSEFPVGTIILKESNQAEAIQRVVFAMVKRQARGTGYNTGGDDGWEWWSVTDLGNCNVERLWRGTAPPTGESYAGQPVGDCNGCHGMVVDNDYVWDTALQLSKF